MAYFPGFPEPCEGSCGSKTAVVQTVNPSYDDSGTERIGNPPKSQSEQSSYLEPTRVFDRNRQLLVRCT